MKNVSILMTLIDRVSSSAKSISAGYKSLSKDADEAQNKLSALASKQNYLVKQQAQLKTSLAEAAQKVKEATKAFKESGDEISRVSLNKANEEYIHLKQSVSEYGSEIKRTAAESRALAAEQSKLGSRADGAFGQSAAAQILGSQLFRLAGDAFAGATGTAIQSALGTPTGEAVASIFSGAATGAILGLQAGSILGMPGAAVGTAIGTVAGSINAGNQVFTVQDEAFKSARGDLIAAEQERAASELSTGTSIAAQRELDKIAFDKILKGDSTGTLEAVKTMATTTPFLYEDLKGITKTLATYGTTDPEAIKKRLTQIGDTGAALGMSSADMSMVAAGLGRMQSSGKTTLEYLNLLIERGIPAVDYLAEAMGASNTEVYNMVSKGLIPGAEAAEIIANAMGEANSGAMAEMAETYSGITSTVQGLEQERQNARGEGYIEERSKGMQDQTEYLQNNKKEIGETERLIGQWEASLDNERDAIRREKEAEAYERIKRDGLTGAEAGRVLAEARIAAEAEYNATDGAQLKLESELLLTENVTSMLAENPRFWDANYRLGIEASKGIASGIQKGLTTEELYGVPFSYESAVSGDYGAGNAYGLSYVPYDNYPARLHEGERVLTAAEARAYNTGGGGAVVQKLADTIVVREDADIDRIASELARKLREMQMVS